MSTGKNSEWESYTDVASLICRAIIPIDFGLDREFNAESTILSCFKTLQKRTTCVLLFPLMFKKVQNSFPPLIFSLPQFMCVRAPASL